MNLREHKKELMKDPEFRKAYEARADYDKLIRLSLISQIQEKLEEMKKTEKW